MKKTLLLLIIIISTIITGGCSSSDPGELAVINHPEKINPGDKFSFRGEYRTEDPGHYDRVEVLLYVNTMEDDKTLLARTIELKDDRSQYFDFSDLELEEIAEPVYFKLKLLGDGRFISSLDTRSDITFYGGWKTSIITTYFDGEGETNSWGESLDEGNQYYFALPYRDFAFEVEELEGNYGDEDYYGITDVKNRWLEVYYPKTERTVYVQWRDVGPWNIYDPLYVFEDDRPYAEKTGVDMGWLGYYRKTNGAGLDLSPEAMKYIIDQESGDEPEKGLIETSWRFVEEEEVPDGPWKEEISTDNENPEIFNTETETLRTVE